MTMERSLRQLKESIDLGTPRLTRLRHHPYFHWVVISSFLFSLACIHVWQRVTVIESGRAVQKLQGERIRLQDETKKLRSQIAQLSMISRISRYASDSLGMRPIPPQDLFTIIERPLPERQPDDMSMLVASLERLADYLPVQATASALSRDLEPVRFDTATVREGVGR